MAMTKAEQQRMDNLDQAVRLARSLRWPEYPMPAPMTIEQINANKVAGGDKWGSPELVAFGWLANSYGNGSVTRGCSNGVNHGTGNTTSTQGAGRLFATELEGWQSVRIEMTERFAKLLADVDAKIERLRD